jgi:hypothetical protein
MTGEHLLLLIEERIIVETVKGGPFCGYFVCFLTERIVYFLNTVHCYNILEEYYYYEIQIHKALCDFTV